LQFPLVAARPENFGYTLVVEKPLIHSKHHKIRYADNAKRYTYPNDEEIVHPAVISGLYN
jgi:hypothetical protein